MGRAEQGGVQAWLGLLLPPHPSWQATNLNKNNFSPPLGPLNWGCHWPSEMRFRLWQLLRVSDQGSSSDLSLPGIWDPGLELLHPYTAQLANSL